MDITKAINTLYNIIEEFNKPGNKHGVISILVDEDIIDALFVATGLMENNKTAFQRGYEEAAEKIALFIRDEIGVEV